MKKNILITILALLIGLCFSCTSSSQEAESNNAEKEGHSNSTEKKTQALILLQPFELDTADQNKVTGDYVAQDKVTVPQDLGTQNKWFMFEGPVLENDLIAYRFYADSRHRCDIFGKTVSDLVMDTVGWEYHEITNWGSDILMVGKSLGLGSPAIWYQDTLYTLSDCEEKTIEIIENLPAGQTSDNNSSTIKTTFKGLSIKGKTFDLVQNWTIEEGQPWSGIQLKVTNGSLPEGMSFATGIVKHLPGITTGETTDYFYAMNWGKQSYHKENMGMAILASKRYQPEHVADELSHAYVFKNANNEIRYRFLAVWERDNNKVTDVKGFKQLVENAGK